MVRPLLRRGGKFSLYYIRYYIYNRRKAQEAQKGGFAGILQKFEKSLKKWLTKGDGSSIISKLSHDSGQPKGWKGCFHLKAC